MNRNTSHSQCKVLTALTSALAVFVGGATGGELQISRGTVQVKLSGAGDLVSSVPLLERALSSSSPAVVGSLVFSRGGGEKMAFEAEQLRLKGVVAASALVDPHSDLVFTNPAGPSDRQPQAVLGSGVVPSSDGVLYLAGLRSAPQPTARRVAYVDGVAVYEQYFENGPLQIAYVNLTSPAGGVEGRTDFALDGSGMAGRYYYVKDHLGSTRLVVDEDMDIIEATSYLAYGTVVPPPGAPVTPAAEAREKFTGKELDGEGAVNGAPGIGLFYFGARYYDPELGMFVGTDVAHQYWNSYSYTGGDPIRLIDPTGMAAWEATSDWTDEQIQGYQTYAADFISSYTEEIDCADLGLIALVNYASENNLPLNLRYYDKGWKFYNASSDAFTSVAQYLNTVRMNMGALGIIDNTSAIALSNAAAGDLIMSRWSSTLGHTRIISSIVASGSDYSVTWYQGNLPAAVPEQRQSLYGDINSVYGNSPRRWNFSQW